jgi:hypothetical protein
MKFIIAVITHVSTIAISTIVAISTTTNHPEATRQMA